MGLTGGLFFGVHLREKGYSSRLTKAYYTFQNRPDENLLNHPNVDDIFEYYRRGLIDDNSDMKDFDVNKIDRIDLNNSNQDISTPDQNTNNEVKSFLNKIK